MTRLSGFDFFPLNCDGDGKIEKPSELQALVSGAGTAGTTDVIFIAHGFRNDAQDATALYSEFLETFASHLSRPEFPGLATRRFVVCGVFWPSKAFKESFDEGSVQAVGNDDAEKRDVKRRLEEMKASDACQEQRPKIQRAIDLLDRVEDSAAAQDEFVPLVLSLLDDTVLDPTEGLEKIRAQEGSRLLELLESPLLLPLKPGVTTGDTDSVGLNVGGSAFGDDDGQTESLVSVFGSIFGRIGQFLNLTTWYLMKDRSGKVGEHGCAKAVSAVQAASSVRVHLVGHSLGGRLMASCAKTLATQHSAGVDSLMLLQAAFSHYGLSSTRTGKAGFFRNVIDDGIVKGPLVVTFSAKDSVVGKAYAIMSRLANDNVMAIGDENDEFGGLGRNGSQNAPSAVVEPLHLAGAAYSFSPGKIINLDGSKGLITSHGDVRNANVTYAFASAVART